MLLADIDNRYRKLNIVTSIMFTQNFATYTEK